MRSPVLLLALLLPVPAMATTLDVPSQYADISAALDDAVDGDTIRIDANQYQGENGLIDSVLILKSVTLEGINGRPILPGLLTGTNLDLGFRSVRFASPVLDSGLLALYRQSGGTLTVEDVVLPPSSGAPGFYLVGVAASFDELQATGFSGERPIEARDGSVVTIANSTFSDNQFGAVLGSGLVSVTIEDSVFTDNFAGRGADLEALGQSSFVVRRSTFTGSRAANGGGSIYAERSALDVDDCDFREVISDGAGGAVFATMSATGADAGDDPWPIAIRNSTFQQVSGVDQGGVLLLNNNDTVIEDTEFTGTAVSDGDPNDSNLAEGGAIAAGAGSLVVRRATFRGFSAPDGNGGAIAVLGSAFSVDQGALVVEDSAFYGDAARVEAGRGGAIDIADAVATLSSVTIEDVSTNRLGGGVYVVDGALTSNWTTIKRVATTGVGGGYRAQRSDLTVWGGSVAAAEADQGAGIAFGQGTAQVLEVDSVDFLSLDVQSGPAAILVEEAFELAITQSRFCTMASVSQDASVVGIRGNLATPSEFSNNIALGMDGSIGAILRRGTPESAAAVTGSLSVLQNTLIEADPIDLWEGAAFVQNNLFGWAGTGVHAGAFAGSVTGDYNLWWSLGAPADPSTLDLPGAHAVFADPLLRDYTPGDCGWSGFLDPDSPARDAGSPDVLDADGGPSDIGATGGPGTILQDADGDGVYEDLDCDDQDATVHPGAEEIWFDDIDQDCDGNWLDQDLDGHDWPEDCDDTNASIHPLATDTPRDGIDQDCDGTDAESSVGSGCGCATDGSPAGAWWAFGALALAARRRSRGASRASAEHARSSGLWWRR